MAVKTFMGSPAMFMGHGGIQRQSRDLRVMSVLLHDLAICLPVVFKGTFWSKCFSLQDLTISLVIMGLSNMGQPPMSHRLQAELGFCPQLQVAHSNVASPGLPDQITSRMLGCTLGWGGICRSHLLFGDTAQEVGKGGGRGGGQRRAGRR